MTKLVEENQFLKKNNEELILKNKSLTRDYLELKNQNIDKERNLNQVLEEYAKYKQLSETKSINQLISEKELFTKIETWQRIVDEIAHSINTDVYIAVSNLEKHKNLPRIQKAFYHTKQIRDLTNLLMWYIKRNELEISGEMKKINIADVIRDQIKAVKEGISTLRLSSDEHQENILKLNIPVVPEGDLTISINKEISESITLILKDIVRNALKNTEEFNPEVKIKLIGTDKNVSVEVWNNEAISEDYASWFNNETTNEPQNISKSFKVGLRVIKMWIDLLKIKAKLIPDYESSSTTARIIFPKEIRYEKN